MVKVVPSPSAKGLGVDTGRKRAARADLSGAAHPQHGVAALRRAFSSALGAPAGVGDAAERAGGAGARP